MKLITKLYNYRPSLDGLAPTPGFRRLRTALSVLASLAVLGAHAAPFPSEGGLPSGGTYSDKPFIQTPTPNLDKVANSIGFKFKSVTTLVQVRAGLNVTRPVEISILFGTTRVTQQYVNATGNRFLFNFDSLDGLVRNEPVVITLTEKTATGQPIAHVSIPCWVPIEPLFDVSISPLIFTPLNAGDSVGNSEIHLEFRRPGAEGIAEFSVAPGESVELEGFAAEWTEVGVSDGFLMPVFRFYEDDWIDHALTGFGAPFAFSDPEPMLPGHTRAVKLIESSALATDPVDALIRYTITMTLRWYPFL